MKLNHSMSSLEVQNAILHAFDGVISDFTTLECDQLGHNLFQAEQIFDSGVALQRRGCRYLCEVVKGNVLLGL